MRVIAVDWSGAAHTARNHIWLAECVSPGHLVRLECGRTPQALVTHVLSLSSVGVAESLVVGFDFAFSFPSWFIEQLALTSAPDLWAHVATHGEQWLAHCEPPFWGRPGHPRPPQVHPAQRRTDAAVPRTAGVAPKSIFQIGGAGTVGTGSLRGMPVLHQLHAAGARIWPFTKSGSPLVLEIYPRLLTGPVLKSNPVARATLLDQRYPQLSTEHRLLAVSSDDAFDAAVSALEMRQHTNDLATLPHEFEPILRLEGRIWHPDWRNDRC